MVTSLMELAGQERKQAIAPSSSYSAAFYESRGDYTAPPELVVFPIGGAAVHISLPPEFGGGVTYSADGTALYGVTRLPEPSSHPQLSKIQFNPLRATALRDSSSLSPFTPLAVSSTGNRVLVSGDYHHDGSRECGVFELSVPEGTLRRILEAVDCNYLSSWGSLSFSPNTEEAVAIRKGRLHLIDLVHLSTRSLGDGFLKAAWSPDGKWIAALENGGRWRTMLLDSNEFKIRKTLGNTEVEWSPDSRYLLAMKEHDHCKEEHGTLEAVDIETGRRWTIESSKCQVNQVSTGWVSSAIVP